MPALTDAEIEALTGELMDPDGEFLTRRKVLNRSRLIGRHRRQRSQTAASSGG
jgi:hypothetical protein